MRLPHFQWILVEMKTHSGGENITVSEDRIWQFFVLVNILKYVLWQPIITGWIVSPNVR